MSTDLTPGTDLAVIDPAAVEAAADPAQFVVQACERAKTWLANALEHGGIDDIVELKSQAEAIRIYTMQKQLGKDAELSAAEIVRRAERGIGLAIRKGQENDEIRRQGETARRPGHVLHDGNNMEKRAAAEARAHVRRQYRWATILLVVGYAVLLVASLLQWWVVP